MNGWHCRRTSMLNNIGGARPRSFYTSNNRWRGDISSVCFCDVVRFEEYIELIWKEYTKYCRGFMPYYLDRLKSQRRFGPGAMPFTVRRISYRKENPN